MEHIPLEVHQKTTIQSNNHAIIQFFLYYNNLNTHIL